jgi:hypothetical protein
VPKAPIVGGSLDSLRNLRAEDGYRFGCGELSPIDLGRADANERAGNGGWPPPVACCASAASTVSAFAKAASADRKAAAVTSSRVDFRRGRSTSG